MKISRYRQRKIKKEFQSVVFRKFRKLLILKAMWCISVSQAPLSPDLVFIPVIWRFLYCDGLWSTNWRLWKAKHFVNMDEYNWSNTMTKSRQPGFYEFSRSSTGSRYTIMKTLHYSNCHRNTLIFTAAGRGFASYDNKK